MEYNFSKSSLLKLLENITLGKNRRRLYLNNE